MGISNDLKGARLEFVLRPVRGKNKRFIRSYDAKEKKIVTTEAVDEKPHYMLFLPNGSSYHLTAEQATRRGFAGREPNILGLEGVQDNTSSAGKFKFGINEKVRLQGYKEMEEAVIKACQGRAAVSLLDEKEAA